MDSFEFNKILGAVLGSLLFTMAIGLLSDGLFSTPKPKTPGYALPAAEAVTEASNAPAAPSEPLPVLLAKADPVKGEANAKACTACHNFQKGAAAKVGPPLYGILGRPKGSIAGFSYSEGLKGKGGEWTFEDLNQFIANPKGYIAGTKMSYAGEKDDAKRAAILAYLRSLADSPVPLPAP